MHNYVQGLKDFREEHKKENDKEKSLKHRWLDFTQVFSQQSQGKSYKVDSVSLGNRSFAAICSYKFSKVPKVVNLYKEGMKFKGADKIIKRVAYK